MFGAVTSVLALFVVAAGTLALDVYTHNRLAKYAALNVWGYRGPIVGRKQAGECRILVIGGSTVFGVGYPWDQAFPVKLEQRLRGQSSRRISVVNLGFPGENAYAYRATLEDFRYLQPDVVILYGDNNVDVTAHIVLRHESAVFRLTGYYPLLSTALREKAMALRYAGDLGAAYRNESVSTKPGVAARMAAGALAQLAAVGTLLQTPLDRLVPQRVEPLPTLSDCAAPWVDYCGAMYAAIADARAHGYRTIVVNQPYASPRWVDEQRMLRAMLQARFGADPLVHYLDLGWSVDLHDPALAYDGMHLTPEGNRRIADRLADYLRGLIDSSTS